MFNSKNTEWLRKGYDTAVSKGDLSALTGFEHYVDVAKKVEKKLVWKTTSDDVEIQGYVTHFLDRVIGSYEKRREPVSIKDIKAALKSSEIKNTERNGKPGRVYIGENCDVTINPLTQLLIQATPKIKQGYEE